MSTVIYALDILPLDPDGADWLVWIGPERAAAASRFLRKEDRARCIGAGLLLAFAVSRHVPGAGIPPRVEADANGKPYLPDMPGLHFNISHSGKWVVCGVGDRPLGVDIERTGRDIIQVAKRYFSPGELKHLELLTREERKDRLMSIWVIKESYMKATGLGLRLPLNQLEVGMELEPVLLHGGRKVPYGTILCPLEDQGYRLGLAVMDAKTPPPYRLEPVGFEALMHHLTQWAKIVTFPLHGPARLTQDVMPDSCS